MSTFIIAVNVIFGSLFGLIGLVSLAGVIVAGAWWHLITAQICAVPVIFCFWECRKEMLKKRNAKTPQV